MIIKSVDVYSVPFDSEHRDVFFGTSAQFKQFIDDNFHLGTYSARKTEDLTVNGSTINITDDTAILVLPFNVEGTDNKNRRIFDTNYIGITTTTDELLYYFVEGIETLNNIVSDDDVVRMSVKFTLKFDVFANYLDVLNQPQQRQFIKRSHIRQYIGDPPEVVTKLHSPSFTVKPYIGLYNNPNVFDEEYDILFKVYIFSKGTDSNLSFDSNGNLVKSRLNWNNEKFIYGSSAMEYYFAPVKIYHKGTLYEVADPPSIIDLRGNQVRLVGDSSNIREPDVQGTPGLVGVKYTFNPPFTWEFDEESLEIKVNSYCDRSVILTGDGENPNFEFFKSFISNYGTVFCGPNLEQPSFNGNYLLYANMLPLFSLLDVEYDYPTPNILLDPLDAIPYNPVLRRYPFSHIEIKIGDDEWVPFDQKFVTGVDCNIYYKPSIDGTKYYFLANHGEYILLNTFTNVKFVNSGQSLPYSIDTYDSYIRNNGESLSAKRISNAVSFLATTTNNTLAFTSPKSAPSAVFSEVTSATEFVNNAFSVNAMERDLKNAVDTVQDVVGGNIDDIYVDRILFRLAIFDRIENTNFNKELVRQCIYYGYEYNEYGYPFERVTWFYKYVETINSKIVSVKNLKHRGEIESKLNRGLTLWFISGFNETFNSSVQNYFKNLNRDIINVPMSSII